MRWRGAWGLAVVLAGGCSIWPPAAAGLPAGPAYAARPKAEAPTRVVFSSPRLEEWHVPADVSSVTLEVTGGQGGPGALDGPPGDGISGNAEGSAPGGRGAVVTATLAVTPGEVLGIAAGEAGGSGEWGNISGSRVGALGYEDLGIVADGGGEADGGAGGAGSGVAVMSGGPQATLIVAGGGGGAGFGAGAEDITEKSLVYPSLMLALNWSRGGAGGASEAAGEGGEPIGVGGWPGGSCSTGAGHGGGGASASSPGAFGQGGDGDCFNPEPAVTGVSTDGDLSQAEKALQPEGEFPGVAGSADGKGAPGNPGGGGGGGYHGGGAGGGESSISFGPSDDEGESRQYQAGSAGGGGGSNYVAAALTDVSIANGAHEGDGEVVVSYVPPGVDIQSAPPELTNLHSATFEFSTVIEGVYYECKLDGSQWEVCTSPASYSNLADGTHTFEVRAVPNGGTPTQATVRTWTIENTVPQALVTASPSGNVKENTAKIEWVSSTSQAGVTFECQLDAQPAYACASPQRLVGLAVGHHDFYITAINQFGERSPAPTTVEWTVVEEGSGGSIGLQPPPSTSCAAPATAKASSGLLFVVGREGTCLVPSQLNGEPVWMATGPVTVNGIGLIPKPGSKIVLARSTAAVLETTGPSSVRLGTREPVSVPFAFTWAQNAGSVLSAYQGLWKGALSSTPGNLSSAGHPPAEMGLLERFAGLGVLPVWPTIELSGENGGAAKIALQVTLPRAFSPLPTEHPDAKSTTSPKSMFSGVGGSIGVMASNETGVSVNGSLSIDSTIWLGPLSVSGLRISYENQNETFSGNMNLGLVGTERQLAVGITIGPEGQPAVLGCCIQKLSIAPQNLNVPIAGSPVVLQSIEGNLGQEVEAVAGRQQTFAKFGGGVGVSVGPKVLGVSALELKGSASWLFSSPYVLEAAGSASVLGFPTRNAKLTYKPGVEWRLSGNIVETLLGYGFTAAIKNSFFQGLEQFNIEGEGETVFPVIGRRNVKVVLSNKGLAACSEESGLAGGLVPPFTFGWAILFPSKTPKLLSESCDLGPYTATASSYHTTAAGTPRTIRLTGRPEAHVIRVTGEGAAPQVSVSGPDGLTLHGGVAQQTGGLIVSQAAADETDILLADGSPGTYSITSSNAPITGIAIASELPAVKDHVTVRREAGGHRQLTYREIPAPGEQLELYEQGAPGTGRLLKATSAARGTFAFTPAVGLGAHRHILAITLNDGLPRHREDLAPFTVDELLPARIIGLRRRRHTLTWRPDPRAARYAVAFYDRRGVTTESLVTTRPLAPIPTGAIKAVAVPIDSAGRPGPTSSMTLTPPRKRTHQRR